MSLFFLLFTLLLAVPVFYPQIDLLCAHVFYRADSGFYLADNLFFQAIHWVAFDGARVMGAFFILVMCVVKLRKRSFGGLDVKSAFFLLLTLVIGTGLIVNVGLKDHWGRARPREVVEFGGASPFTPALEPHFEKAHNNGSFVAGDAAFGFFLPAFAYISPKRKSKKIFWGSMALGAFFGFDRIVMGAHFLSDVFYAAFVMLSSTALIYRGLYGSEKLKERWRLWFSSSKDV